MKSETKTDGGAPKGTGTSEQFQELGGETHPTPRPEISGFSGRVSHIRASRPINTGTPVVASGNGWAT